MLLKSLTTTARPSALFRALKQKYRNSFLLESADGPDKLVRYSFLGFAPAATVSIKNTTGVVRSASSDRKIATLDDETTALSFLRDVLAAHTEHDAFDDAAIAQTPALQYAGGLVGFISYDFIRTIERVPATAADDLPLPDALFGVYHDGIIYDHGNNAVLYFSRKDDRSAELLPLLAAAEKEYSSSVPDELRVGPIIRTPDKATFEKNVEQAKRYVYDGDVLQVVISKRCEAPYTGDFDAFYERLRATNPGPYMYYLDFDDAIIVGSSPEMLGRIDGTTVETFPIAGTRPITGDAAQDARYEQELLADEKERAEHVMLVDLARNDLGRVCKHGTVTVADYMTVEHYSHVQHIVSRVTGTLTEDCDAFDALGAIFPAGTVSGAPKIRAMEIIDELEPVRRGPYAGAVGYFSYNGNMDLAIAIRTLFANKNKLVVQSGAGIVADSRPENEWFETEDKAKALLAILGEAVEDSP